jgi:hypothetical protein
MAAPLCGNRRGISLFFFFSLSLCSSLCGIMALRLKEDPAWVDVVPQAQADGPTPACAIAYTTECTPSLHAVSPSLSLSVSLSTMLWGLLSSSRGHGLLPRGGAARGALAARAGADHAGA